MKKKKEEADREVLKFCLLLVILGGADAGSGPQMHFVG